MKRSEVICIRRVWLFPIRMAVSVVILMLCSSTAAARTGLVIGEAFPRFSLGVLDGGLVTLPDAAAGRIAVIHFWAGWCPLCVREMPAIQAVQERYGAEVAAFSINAGESAETARAFVRKLGLTYSILLDHGMVISRQCGILSIPTTFICDRNGTIRFKILGEISQTDLEKLVTGLI